MEPARFASEAERLLPLLKGRVRSLEHVGSTAVPGLCAKPTIDMLGDVDSPELADACIPSLADAGYIHVPDVDQDWPDRRFFFLESGRTRPFQLHLVKRGDAFWTRCIRLREDPDKLAEYRELKLRLAREHRADVAAYTRAKSDFIMGVAHPGASRNRRPQDLL